VQPTFNNPYKHGKTKSNNNSTLHSRDLFRLSNNGPNQQRERACEKKKSRSKLSYTIEIKLKKKTTLGRKAYRHKQAILII